MIGNSSMQNILKDMTGIVTRLRKLEALKATSANDKNNRAQVLVFDAEKDKAEGEHADRVATQLEDLLK